MILFALMFAEHICIPVNETVTVTAGIHIDSASTEDINRIKNNLVKLLDKILVEL